MNYNPSPLLLFMRGKGITTEELAHALNISRVTLSRKMNGYLPWKWDEVLGASQYLGLSMEQTFSLFGGAA